MVRKIVRSNFNTAVNPMATATAAGQRIINNTPRMNPRPGAQQPGESAEGYQARIEDERARIENETGNLMSKSEVEKEDTPATKNRKMLVIGAAVLAIIFLISKTRK